LSLFSPLWSCALTANCCFVGARKNGVQAQLEKHYPQDHKAEENTEDIYFEQLINLKNGSQRGGEDLPLIGRSG
jgi:hypothetical protein